MLGAYWGSAMISEKYPRPFTKVPNVFDPMDIYRLQIAADNEIVRHTRANPRALKQCHGLPRRTSSTAWFNSGIVQCTRKQKC